MRRASLLVPAVVLTALFMAGCVKSTPARSPAQTIASPMHRVIPRPVTVTPAAGVFTLDESTRIVVPEANTDAVRVGQYLSALFATGPRAKPLEPASPAEVHLVLGSVAGAGDEGYDLAIVPGKITITANAPAGLFYGTQTLRQLLPAAVEYDANIPRGLVTAPAGRIVDRPRYAWRGAMLDVARHFFSVDDVKRYIDLLALYKFNRLHLHLSDDQGWRIEITSWPNLTRQGGSTEVGGGPGGFYTQRDYAEIVDYAADRFITIVPEIDMPGHTNAALASYPELNCDGVAPPLYTGIRVGFSTLCVDKDVTYQFVDDVVREIAELSGPYFHIGGDEVQKLTPAQYAGFIERVERIVQRHGKEMIGWDEVAAASLSASSIVQHWRPKTPANLAAARRLIMSPANKTYLDMKYDDTTTLGLTWAGLVDVRTALEWDPERVVAGVAPGAVLGVEAPLWSETLEHMRDVEFMAFPRIVAIAEVGWAPAPAEWKEFATRLGAQARRWVALGVNFHRAPGIPWEQ